MPNPSAGIEALRLRDGRFVHVTYTWKRERIRHVVLDPAAIR